MIRKTGVRRQAVGLAAAGLLLGACSVGGGDDKPGASGGGQSKELKWASCMRDAGVPVEDPKPGQPLQQVPEGTDQSKTEAAFKKCQKFAPEGRASDSDKKKWASELRDYAKCMRENGVANMPDPDEEGGLTFPDDGTQETQRFKDADAKCHDKMKSFQRQDVSQ